MSVIKTVDTLNPYAKSDKVLSINLDSQSDAYIMSNLMEIVYKKNRCRQLEQVCRN